MICNKNEKRERERKKKEKKREKNNNNNIYLRWGRVPHDGSFHKHSILENDGRGL